jgi:hypothetical protein
MTTVMDDAYFAEVKRRELALKAVIERHLGPSTDENWTDAHMIVLVMSMDGGRFDAMNRREERERLRRFQSLAREIARAWQNLHPDIQATIANAAWHFAVPYRNEDDHPFPPRFAPRDFPWGGFWDAFREIDKLIDFALPRAHDCIDAAPEIGRRNVRAVNVVDDLRKVWAKRKGTPAPMNITEAGPFADFLIEAFEALGLEGNPRAAMDSWREYRAKHPES